MVDPIDTSKNTSDGFEETQPVDSIQEELVAYLDGELTPTEIDRIEKKLASDTEYRAQLLKLQQAWDALDHLPHAETSESFTQSTVELVTKSLEVEVKAKKQKHRSRRIVWGTAAVVLISIAAVGGYQLTRWFANAPNRQLADDLEVIENVDLYRNADDITFLEKLAEEGLFEE